MLQEIWQWLTSALTTPKGVAVVTSTNAASVLALALDVYTLIASAIIITLSGMLTFYMYRKTKKESELLDIQLAEARHRRKEDDG